MGVWPAASASGAPLAITRPPSGPPPGPSSSSQSHAARTCGWCSITKTECPASTSRLSTPFSRATSSRCWPTVGSSRMYSVPSLARLHSSLAILSRCTSPPESA